MSKVPKVAICYDFDKTLCPDDMQVFSFIPSVGMDVAEFWEQSNKMAMDNKMDMNLSWMKKMIDESKRKNKSIKRETFCSLGKDVTMYHGVDSWFERINDYGRQKNIEVEHYIISSGLKEIIEGSVIAPYIKRIYASTFMYDVDNIAVWPAQAVNYTNKTQFIFRIAKGAFDENDNNVNQNMQANELYIPYENMIYIGDSDTDIPSMRVVKNNRRKVYTLFKEKRIDYFAPADYSEGEPLFGLAKQIIDMISTREALKRETERLQRLVDSFVTYETVKQINDGFANDSDKIDMEILQSLKNTIEGNVD